MFDRINIGKNVADFASSKKLDGYTMVVVHVTDELEYVAGNDSGRTLTIECPWGTQQIAEDALKSLSGFQYQPYTADGAVVNPAAELGDAVVVSGVFGGVYSSSDTFGGVFRADLSAPEEEEVDEAAHFKSVAERQIERQALEYQARFRVLANEIGAEVEARKEDASTIKSALSVQAESIAAKVSKSGGDNSSFGWELTDSSWTLTSGGADVLKATKDGAEITGIIKATGGEIGGFSIQENYLSYNEMEYGSDQNVGAYIGVSGLQFGKNFRVDTSGKLYAMDGEFGGTVKAKNILTGSDAGYISGAWIGSSSITGTQIAASTLGTTKFLSGVNTSLAYADEAHNYFSGITTFDLIKGRKLSLSEKLYIDGKTIMFANAMVSTPNGDKAMNLVTWYNGII